MITDFEGLESRLHHADALWYSIGDWKHQIVTRIEGDNVGFTRHCSDLRTYHGMFTRNGPSLKWFTNGNDKSSV